MTIFTGQFKMYSSCVFLLGIMGISITSWGQTVPIVNPSFELGEDAPEGWQLSSGEGGWFEDAAEGSRAVSVTGTANSQASTYWYTDPVSFDPNACYRFTFQARRLGGSGGSPITGPTFCNRDLHEITADWKKYTSYFLTPSGNSEAPLRLGQWNAEGTIAFDDVSLVCAEPVYLHKNGVALGDGESIMDNQYVFTAPLNGDSANHARTLKGYDCTFNKPRWVFSNGKWVLYSHDIGGLKQSSAEVEVTIGYYRGGTLVVEASSVGKRWIEVGRMDNMGTSIFPIPASMCPAEEIQVRFTTRGSDQNSAPVNLQIHGYTYRATLESAPGNFFGKTTFVAVPESDGKVQLSFPDLGEGIPGGKNYFQFAVTNLSEKEVTITPRLTVSSKKNTAIETTMGAMALPADSKSILMAMPYEVTAAGDTSLTLDLGEKTVYRAEADFNISCIYESGYGMTLSNSSDKVALWWASSGWKISRNRPVPKEPSPAMHIQLAQNEWEAAQFVLRPVNPLNNLRIKPQALKNTQGQKMPADSIEVLRVGYVPVTRPTDYVGTVAPWPDPLPPITKPLKLNADENQPFWVCVHTTKDTTPGKYSGTILLEADDWQATVPLEVEVFDFSLPDRKTCTSAFGFSAPLAFQYHNVKTEADQRVVYDNYLSILSDHHISIYDPTYLDPMSYDWPHLPKWQGGKRDFKDSRDEKDGAASLMLHDESTTANVATHYDERFAIPENGLHIQFDYKTGTPEYEFQITLLHYNAAGNWMSGRNNDIVITGDGSWQHFSQKISAFPDGATQFMLRFWATRYSEEGAATGSIWLDNVEVGETGSNTILIQEDFQTPYGDLKKSFVPEFDWTDWDAAMTRAFDQYHFNGFRLGVPGMGHGTFHARYEPNLLGYGEDTPEYKTAFSSWCQAVEAHLREKGWLDYAYVYWFDEPEPDDYEFVMNGFRKLKEAAPGINRMLTEQMEPELIGGPNIWCPVSHNYDYDKARARQAAGDTIWWYVCTGPKAPYATLFIDHPATELRVWLWQTWERSIEGVLIWQTNYWHSKEAYPDAPQNPYEDPMGWTTGYSTPVGTKRPWGNGDGRFIYPPLAAADGQPEAPVFDDPVSSIRLEMLRDGIEDYEYCVILSDLLGKCKNKLTEEELTTYRRLLEVPDDITKSMTEFTWDPEPIETHREAVARAIVELQRQL